MNDFLIDTFWQKTSNELINISQDELYDFISLEKTFNEKHSYSSTFQN